MPILGVITSSAVLTLTEGDRAVFNRIHDETEWEVDIIVWDWPSTNLERCDAFIFRSCWDYYLHQERFLAFLDRLESQNKPIFNPIHRIRDNMHKFYLAHLQLKGIQIVPTVFLKKGEEAYLTQIMEDNHWEKVVIKPAVSAASHDTWIGFFSEVKDDEKILSPILKEKDLLVQPFISEIQGLGEFSTIFFSNGCHYTVRKTPIDGEFRIQKEYGGLYSRTSLKAEWFDQVLKIWHLIKEDILVARIDGVFIDGEFHLMELELIEPDLYLDIFPERQNDFFESIRAKLDQIKM